MIRNNSVLMNKPLRLTRFALRFQQRLLLSLGLLLALSVLLFNSLSSVIDISGWSSGFIHPLHGGDHLLTMLAVGIWAAQLRGSAIWLLPVTFVGVMSLGGIAGAAGLLIPGAEPIILLSCLVFGVLITRRIRFSSRTNVLIVAFFAFFHGFAHGQEISTSVSLISYTLGFMVATILLHGAGILVVRLLVMLFALFLSHLTYAQSESNNSIVKLSIEAQTNNFNGHIIGVEPAPPNNRHNQLFLSGSEDGTGHAGHGHQPHSHTHLFDLGRDQVRSVYHATCNIAFLITADLPIDQQLGTQFLTSGVGVTSPPDVFVVNITPRFCTAAFFGHLTDITVNDSNKVLETTPNFDLSPAIFTPATSFLTNGVGSTSPPVLALFADIYSLDFDDIAFGNTLPFISPSARPSAFSRSLFSRNSPNTKMRLKSLLHFLLSPCNFLSTNNACHPALHSIYPKSYKYNIEEDHAKAMPRYTV